MTIMKWKPVRGEMTPFGTWPASWTPMSRLMEEFFNQTRDSDLMVWGPNVDIMENEGGYEIHAELPGVKQEDVKLTLNNNTLTVSGEKRQEVKEDKDNFLRVERSYGRFERSFSLPTSVQGDNVHAVFEDGVLRITVPKAETARARNIRIESKK